MRLDIKTKEHVIGKRRINVEIATGHRLLICLAAQKRIKDSEGRNTRKGEFDKKHNCFQNWNSHEQRLSGRGQKGC